MSEQNDSDSKLSIFRTDCVQAQNKFNTTIDDLRNNAPDKHEAIRGLINALTEISMEIAYAKERIGLIGEVEATRNMILKSFDDLKPANFGVASERLASVSAAYKNDFRPATGGVPESRMRGARTFAARLEQGDTIAKMVAEVCRGLEPDYDFDAVEKSAVTIEQSLKRLRNSLRVTAYYRFDPATLRLVTSEPSEELWADLPKGRGRPKSN